MNKHNRKKIEDLFSYRKIPWMLEKARIKRKKNFLKKLIRLQDAIYNLDLYLESNWVLENKALAGKWDKIYHALAKFDISKKNWNKWCRNIYLYEQQEKALRKGISPVQVPIDHFYFYKSCDVKLIRALIYRADRKLRKSISPEVWIPFDLITEINDDIDDLFEDMLVINCNRFLFAISALGVSKTRKQYSQFITQIESTAEGHFHTLTKRRSKKMGKMIRKEAKATQKLLQRQIRKLKKRSEPILPEVKLIP